MKFNSIIPDIFKHKPTEEVKQPPSGDTAYAKSSMYSGIEWPQYNPDDLMSRKGSGIYRKMMRDDQIKVVAKFRRNAVTGRAWSFVLDTDELSEQEVEFRIKLLTETVRRMKGSFKKKLDGIMTSLYFGFSMSEKTFELFEFDNKSYYGVSNIRLKPFSSFYFYTDKFGNLLRVVQQIDGEELPDLDIEKFIHHTHNNEEDEYYGSSELREAYRDWFSKEMAYRFRNIWLERCAAGFPVITPQGERVIQPGSPEYAGLVNMLTNIKTNTGMLLPNGVELELKEFTDTEAFDRALSSFDKALAKALLMPNMLGFSGENKSGSRALGETQLEAFLWMLDAEALDLEETVNEQLFQQLCDLNFGDGIYPRFTLAPLSDKQKLNVLSVWGDLISKGAAQRSDSDEEHIRTILEIPEKDEASVTKPIEPNNLNEGSKGGDPSGGGSDNSNGNKPKPNVDKKNDFDSTAPDETLIGKKHLKTGFAKAVKKVDFVAIDQSTNAISFTTVDEISMALGKGIVDVLSRLNLAAIDEDITNIRKLNFKSSTHTEIRKSFSKMLKEAWKIGKVSAKRELRRSLAKDEALLSRFKFERLEDIAAKYFTAESFRMTGDLTDATLSIIRNELSNGVKYSKTQGQIEESIYARLASDGLLDEDIMLQALGEALGVSDPTHRIKTVVRTNTFSALNEARYSMFTDPELGGFVQALEYSAILDIRVTQICSRLDGSTYPLGSAEWEKYRPPNHYNCRSILIAVTQRDVWEASEPPSIDPQKGFS